MPNTPRLGITIPVGVDIPSGPLWLQEIAQDFDNHAKDLPQGLYSERPAAGVAGRFFYATDKKMWWRDTGAAWVALHNVPLVSSWPPPTAFVQDGFEIDYNVTGGHVWKLKRREADPSIYKWQVISAPSLFNEVLTAQSLNVAGWQNLATVGPSLVVPRDGDYFIDWGCNCWEDYTGSTTIYTGISIGGAAPENDGGYISMFAGGANFDQNDNHLSHMRSRRKNALTAGTVITVKYQVSGAPTAIGWWRWRWMRLRPIRIS